MKVIVNALSATNLSARHVLLGHLRKLSEWTQKDHEYVVVYHRMNKDIICNLGSHVKWLECPGYTAHWIGRGMWERSFLPKLIVKIKPDFLFTPEGVDIPSISIPQVVFAQNPWFLVSTLRRSPYGNMKAYVQRFNYKRTMKRAVMMMFNSEYMRKAYRENAGFVEKRSEIVYQAIDDETHLAAKEMRENKRRNNFQILSVSVMASHKGIETTIEALYKLKNDFKLPAKLFLVGPWADHRYEKRVLGLIDRLALNSDIIIKGYVPRKELYRYYAESKVFCLMSYCESFGHKKSHMPF